MSIALGAAEALLHPEKHTGKRDILTGGRVAGYDGLPDALSKAIGKPAVYKSLSTDEMCAHMERQGLNSKMTDSYLTLIVYEKAGGQQSGCRAVFRKYRGVVRVRYKILPMIMRDISEKELKNWKIGQIGFEK